MGIILEEGRVSLTDQGLSLEVIQNFVEFLRLFGFEFFGVHYREKLCDTCLGNNVEFVGPFVAYFDIVKFWMHTKSQVGWEGPSENRYVFDYQKGTVRNGQTGDNCGCESVYKRQKNTIKVMR